MLNNFNVLLAGFLLTGQSVLAGMTYYKMPLLYYNQIYLLRDSDLCLAVKDKNPGSTLHLTKCDPKDPKQRWEYNELFLKNKFSNLCADGSVAERVTQKPCSRDVKWNTWAIYDKSSYQTIGLLNNWNDRNNGREYSGWCMDVSRGPEVSLKTCDQEGPNQQFGFSDLEVSYQDLMANFNNMKEELHSHLNERNDQINNLKAIIKNKDYEISTVKDSLKMSESSLEDARQDIKSEKNKLMLAEKEIANLKRKNNSPRRIKKRDWEE